VTPNPEYCSPENIRGSGGTAFGVVLPCQNFVAVVVKAWKFLVKHRKHPSDCGAVNLFSSINWRKRALLQKHGIGPFFKSESSNPLQAKMIRLKSDAIGAGNFSNFWRISPGYTHRGGGANVECVRSSGCECGVKNSVLSRPNNHS